MAVVTQWTPGTFCWADLSTTDQEAAKSFYGTVFGWDATDIPMGEGMNYTMMNKDGQTAAAIATMQPAQREMGMPPYWNNYILVDDVAAATEKAASLGANVIMPAMEVMEAGKMSVVQDPSGAMVSLWQGGNHVGTGISQVPGSMSWNELLTHDTAAASSFYSGLLGWNPTVMPMPGMDYTIFNHGEKQVAGMMKIDPAWGPMPANWMTYFNVADCDASCEQIKSLGGKVLMGPNDVPGVGRFATCMDPQGGAFCVIAGNSGM